MPKIFPFYDQLRNGGHNAGGQTAIPNIVEDNWKNNLRRAVQLKDGIKDLYEEFMRDRAARRGLKMILIY